MRLLVLGNIVPQPGHTVRAANVVIYEMLCALAQKQEIDVGYLRVLRPEEAMDGGAGQESTDLLIQNGITVLKEVILPSPPKARPVWKKLLFPKRCDYYPHSIYAAQVETAMHQFKPDMVLIPWSEWLTALCADFPIKKFAYYGNPDHKVGVHRHAFDRRYGICKYSRLRTFFYLKYLEREHLRVMKSYDIVANVAANDAEYYQRNGIPKAFYIQNIWIDRFHDRWQKMRAERMYKPPYKIIANVGQLGATANRYGLEYLGKEVAPALRNLLKDVPYELHIMGKGELLRPIRALLDSPEIKMRGFVDDIDDELIDSVAFLCLNNASLFKVNHTRYLHAWSLGCCVIAHTDAALSLPEMVHEKNALLGGNAEQIAWQIKRAIEKPELRYTMGKNGYETFCSHFLASKVADRLWEAMKADTTESRVS